MSPFFLAALLFVSSSFAYEHYNGYKFLKVDISQPEHRRFIRNIEQEVGFMPDYLGTNWKRNEAHFFLDGNSSRVIRETLTHNNISYSLRNVNPMLFKQRRRRDLNTVLTINDVNNRYLTFDEQVQFITNLAQQNPQLVHLQSLGNSYEGRQIYSVRLGQDAPNKPIIWIDAGMHAREWISYNVALYTIHTLVTDPRFRPLLNNVQLVVVPNANPDGYEYSRTARRMWRKTRSRHTAGGCRGADGNRNYPFYWGTQGVSHSPCSEIFCGVRSQSEPEVLALTSAIQREEQRIKAYIAFHSYGQEILYPWGHTVHTYPSDVEDLKRVGELMAASIRRLHNNQYQVINSGDGLYPAAGASDDWAKSRGIKYAYTIELSPLDDYTGFELPEERIYHVNLEAFEAVLTMIRQITNEFVVPKNTGAATNASTRTFDVIRNNLRQRSRAIGRG